MLNELRIGKSENGRWFRLPVGAVTETFAFLGKRGSGKTYSASDLAEEFLEAAQQVVVLDPLDVWWGLRLKAGGKGAGYPVVVFGGVHGDFPLKEDMGKALADLVVEERVPAVFSMRHMSKAAQRRFVTDFAERLYHRKGEPDMRAPLHLMIDEADAFCPQRLYRGAERMFGAIDSLVRRGRSSGIGVTVITQRPACIHKDVLTQTEILVTHRLTGPQDRKAVKEWTELNGTDEQRATFLKTLSGLPVGTAWVWSPGFLDIFELVSMRARRTFDSSATPKAGETVKAPKALAAIDVGSIEARLKETMEKASADDPKVLKQRVAELERALGDRGGVDQGAKDAAVAKALRVAQACYEHERAEEFKENALVIGSLQRSVDGYRKVVSDFQKAVEEMAATNKSKFDAELKELRDAPSAVVVKSKPGYPDPPMPHSPFLDPRPETGGSAGASPSHPPARSHGGTRNGKRKGQDRMLIALAQHGCAMTDRKLGILAGLSAKSGTFSNYLSALRRAGHIEVEGRGSISITAAGRSVVGEVSPLPTGAGLHEYWAEQLGNGGCRRMFCSLVEVYPNALSREGLGERTELSAGSGTFSNYLSKLRRLGLVENEGGYLKASGDLF